MFFRKLHDCLWFFFTFTLFRSLLFFFSLFHLHIMEINIDKLYSELYSDNQYHFISDTETTVISSNI